MFFYLVKLSSVICWVYGKLGHFFSYYGSGKVCFNLRHVQMRNLTTNQMNRTNQKSLARLVSNATEGNKNKTPLEHTLEVV